MLEWFAIVRVADMASVQWVLGALNSAETPVSLRRAQTWCARMRIAGLVDVGRFGPAGRSAVWATSAAIGRPRPDLLRQTTRHEIAVASTSARYAAAGYAWRRDDRPVTRGGHQADGVALGTAWTELIEVELTAKRAPRYATIFKAFGRRFDRDGVDQVTYLCTDRAALAVEAGLRDLPSGRAINERVIVQQVFDREGIWHGQQRPAWLPTAPARFARDRGFHPSPAEPAVHGRPCPQIVSEQ